MAEQAFRFLDLPPELRCLVYEELKITATRKVLTQSEAGLDDWAATLDATKPPSSIILIRPGIPFAIMRTCRLIHKEASPILRRNLKEIHLFPIRFMIDSKAAVPFQLLLSSLIGMRGWDNPFPSEIQLNPTSKRYTDQCAAMLHYIRRMHKNVALEVTIAVEEAEITIRDVWSTFFRVHKLGLQYDHRVKIVLKGPLPDPSSRVPGYSVRQRLAVSMVAQYQQLGPFPSDPPGYLPSVDVVELDDTDFVRHLEDLEKY